MDLRLRTRTRPSLRGGAENAACFAFHRVGARCLRALAFIPTGPHASDLLVAGYGTGLIRRFSLTPDGDGFFDLTFEGIAGELGESAGLGDIEFVRSGPFAGNVIVARYSEDYVSLHAFDANLAEVSETPKRLTEDIDAVWGLEIDPVTQDIFISSYDAAQEDPALFQVPEPSAHAAFAAALLALTALRARRHRSGAR